LYDEYGKIKIIASGSSSMDIKNKIQESLAWRKKIFYIYSLDLEEFISWKFILDWKTEKLINFDKFKNIDWNLEKIAKNYYEYLYEYMIFWWYPKTILEKNKQEVLDNIFDLYLKKDILDFLNIKNLTWFKKIVTYLAINNWAQINYTDLSNFSDVDINTTKSYLEILEETFIIKQVKPFFVNKNKEIIKAPKIYFLDNWVRNYFIKNFLTEIDLRADKWELFEGIILQEFVKNNIKDIKYWRTKSWVEVDFIIDNVIKLEIFEVKFKNKIKSQDFSGLEAFEKEYSEKVNKSFLVWKDRCDFKKCISIFDLLNLIK
jgi:predicted AAA+ superfamily ATPase